MAAKPKYNAPYHDNWAWSLAAMGATNEEIALAMGVSERTIMRWAKEHESFGKALGEGKGVSDAKVIRSLWFLDGCNTLNGKKNLNSIYRKEYIQ